MEDADGRILDEEEEEEKEEESYRSKVHCRSISASAQTETVSECRERKCT